MLNQTGVRKENAAVPNQILFNVQHQMSVGVQVAQSAGVDKDGKKIVKAGTPLSGNLRARKTAFTGGGTTPVGVLLHDVDVTKGAANGTLLIFGFVNMDRLDTDTKALVTSDAETSLTGKIWFLND